MKQVLLISIVFLSGLVQAQPQKILLENATVHTGTGQVFEKGLVGIENGKITLLRNALAYSYNRDDWDTIINLDGQHLYPGFVAPTSTLGLTEIDAVRATLDFNEVGIYNRVCWKPFVRMVY